METCYYQQQQEKFSLLGFSPVINSSGVAEFGVSFDTTLSFPIDYNQAMLPPPSQLPSEGSEEAKRRRSHNESEKMRRMKLKSLFASLSSVLPYPDKSEKKKKKIGAPSTLDRVIEYIPQLKKEVEKLIQRKQRLEPTTRNNDAVVSQAATTWSVGMNASSSSISNTTCSSSWSVQVNEIGSGEMSIQISTSRFLVNTFIPISEVLRMLEEEEGLITIEVSSSDSTDGRVFYHVHLMEKDPHTTHKMECELLRKKLLCSCQKWEEMCLWMIIQRM